MTDEEIVETMAFLFERLKIVVEPSGASALAAVIRGKLDVARRRVGVTMSGGNVGLPQFAKLMAARAGHSGRRPMETLAFAALFLVAVLAALYRAARRAITIAELVIDRGSVRVARGGLAAGVLSDVADVASRPPAIRHARVIITRSSGRAEIHLRGEVAAEKAQQLRNVIGGVPLAKLANARHRR